MERNLTCIVCPMGCSLTVTEEGGKLAVSGNTCPRGEVYAREECIAPKRTVTSTVRCENGALLPVKTERTIPKDKIFACMQMINRVKPCLPISVGDVIIEDVFGSRVIAAGNMK